MTATTGVLDERDDATLIAAVRDGDTDAYGVLFERHVDAARRLARRLARDGDADDLVAEAFAKVLPVLVRGDGPDVAFRPYLLTAVRRLDVDRHRSLARTLPTDDETVLDAALPFAASPNDLAVAGFESDAAARAYASLPERWQLVLWHTEVEGQRPADVAPLLGLTPNAVSQLAHRAREGLRQAFVSMHVHDTGEPRSVCQVTRANLGPYIRAGLSSREAARVSAHLECCRPCTAISSWSRWTPTCAACSPRCCSAVLRRRTSPTSRSRSHRVSWRRSAASSRPARARSSPVRRPPGSPSPHSCSAEPR